MNKGHGLSKSRLASFLQCPKRLWLEVHDPDRADETAAMGAAFNIGHSVGEVARRLYPNGKLVELGAGIPAALEQTKALLAASPRTPIFEGTFQRDGVLIRADLLLPARRGWHLAEVKSSARMKPHQINDLAVQRWVIGKAGLRLTRATVRHIDTAFVYRRKNDYEGLFTDTTPDATLDAKTKLVPQWVAAARKTLEGPQPKRDPGPHCHEPHTCPFNDYCASRTRPEPRYPVENFRGTGEAALVRNLREQGFLDIRKVPAKLVTEEHFRRVHKATVSGIAYRDRAKADKAIRAWKYPRAYLDFETINSAVPMWIGTRPYQQIPFQHSCHIEKRDGSVEHRQFIDLSGNNPVRACAEQLVADLKTCRTIVTYSAPFERGVIETLARLTPKLRPELRSLLGRIEDLLPVVRDCYYHRDMGKWYSIKEVLPCLVPELSYDELPGIHDGISAMEAYREAIAESTKPPRKRQIERALLRYCGLDSWAMVAIARKLRA